MPILKSCMMIALVVGVLNLTACAPADDAEEASAESVSEPEAVVASASTTETAAEAEPGAITTESLTGTTWTIADYSITFEADGVVSFNSGSTGTWSLADETITIAAAGEETTITVEGDQLMQNGLALERQ